LNQFGGVSQGRSDFKDSYGNPVTLEYDTLEQIDSKQPSKNPTDPNKFLIPGYASGILESHELPTRSNFGETSRSIDDDRIHFIDPLQNAFGNSDKRFQTPSTSLSPPSNSANNLPINIPRPNIDLNETPQVPVDDPLNRQLNPPKDNNFAAPQAPSVAIEAPQGKDAQFGQGVFIPRPNLDAPETPIDNSNGPLNQGLLPPTSDKSKENSNFPSFISPNQEGPIVFTDGTINFAPKPSNGLLPPKDPSPNDISFQGDFSATTQANGNKFSFGGPSGVLGGTSSVPSGSSSTFGGSSGVLGGSTLNKIPSNTENTVNKFTGSFGGAPGILGGVPTLNNRQQTPTQIPVTVVVAPEPTSPVLLPPAPPAGNNKFTGSFGGPPGVLVNEKFDKTSAVQPSAAPTTSTVLSNKFNGGFGGSSGVLGDKPTSSVSPSVQTPTTLAQLPSIPPVVASRGSQKYTGGFGGLPGVLLPYDNNKN
jgi:hypothetical protein